jgi:hypothetical protein
MKFVKCLGLLALTVVATVAPTPSAWAETPVTHGAGSAQVKLTNTGGHVVIDNPIATINCDSEIKSKSVSSGTDVTGGISLEWFSFYNCTNSWHVTEVSNGLLAVHGIGNGDGTVTSSGATIVATRFGITCRYATNNTHIGTISDGEHAILALQAALPLHGGSGLCGAGSTTWTGAYKVTTPTNLTFD